MANPVTLAAIGMGASAAGGIVGAFGSMFQGQAQANMYQYQAGVAKINQQIAAKNADFARAAGEVEAQQAGMKSRFEIGETKAVQGASNLDVNRGSAVAVRQSEAEVGQQNEALIRSNAARRAYGYEVEAVQAGAQANLYSMSASTSKTSGMIGAISSILGGGASVSSKWLGYQSSFGKTASTPSSDYSYGYM